VLLIVGCVGDGPLAAYLLEQLRAVSEKRHVCRRGLSYRTAGDRLVSKPELSDVINVRPAPALAMDASAPAEFGGDVLEDALDGVGVVVHA
jgi:hypothetical protein